MIFLHFLVEGRSEEAFVKKILCPYLVDYDVITYVQCVQTKNDQKLGKKHKGGITSYERFRTEITNLAKQFSSKNRYFTTFFDLYALPNTFPGRQESKDWQNPYKKVKLIEKIIATDLSDPRIIPYIQLHEFETLILCDAQILDWAYLEHETEIQELKKSISGMNPEEINEGSATAPSKRIIQHISQYRKGLAMDFIVPKIDLNLVRTLCSHFNEWLTTLEGLKETAS